MWVSESRNPLVWSAWSSSSAVRAGISFLSTSLNPPPVASAAKLDDYCDSCPHFSFLIGVSSDTPKNGLPGIDVPIISLTRRFEYAGAPEPEIGGPW